MNPWTTAYLTLLHVLAGAAFVLPWHWDLLPVAVGVYLVGGLGTTLGYHRLLSHRSFACPRWLEVTLVTMAMVNTPGSPLLWVANHRCHHAHADRDGDPHTPLKGFWYAHIGWICDDGSTAPEAWRTWCRDLAQDRYYLWLLRYRMVPQLALIGLLGAAFGVEALPQVFFLPTVAWMNAMFAVNSLCHTVGRRPYPTRDLSRNFWPVGVLALGEGWHNNHHALPYSARHGLRPWQLDLSWWVLRALEALGLAWDVKRVKEAAPEAGSGG